MSALLLFVDGVGIGDADPAVNPFVVAELPVLRRLTGRVPAVDASPAVGERATMLGLDATLGLPGTPQSGTGQATLLTGVNAAERLGRHQGPWIPTALRPFVRTRNLLVRARDAGMRVAFANAYPEEVLQPDGALPSDAPSGEPDDEGSSAPRRRDRRGSAFLRAGPPLAALGAGVLNRHTRELERGDAVASEITNDGWREHLRRTDVPVITPHAAGVNLARIVAAHDLTLFAHYATDYAGHRGGMADACVALERLDAFLGGLLAALASDALVVLASDHGNIEDVRGGHTRNPALCIVAGRDHARVADGLRTLADVAPAILRHLDVPETAGR